MAEQLGLTTISRAPWSRDGSTIFFQSETLISLAKPYIKLVFFWNHIQLQTAYSGRHCLQDFIPPQFITGILSHSSAQDGIGEFFDSAGEPVYKPPDICNFNDFSNDIPLNGDKLLFSTTSPSLGTPLRQNWNFFFNRIEAIPFW